MVQALAMIALFGLLPFAAAVALFRRMPPCGAARLALRLGVQALLGLVAVVAIPELLAAALFPAPAAAPPDDLFGPDFDRNIWAAGVTAIMGCALLASLAVNGVLGVMRLRAAAPAPRREPR